MEGLERIFVACDVSNLWKSCRQEFGDDARVDFQILGSFVAALRHPVQVQQRLVAYMVTNPAEKHHVLASILRSFGYEVCERFMKHKKGLLKPMSTDWDVGITIAAIDQIDTYDTFVLASGDGDFVQLLEYLRTKGKRTIVLSFKKTTARLLYTTADELHVFGESIVFRPNGKGSDKMELARSKCIELDGCQGIAGTEKAVLVNIDGEEIWVPLSQVHADSEVRAKDSTGMLIVSEWFASKKGLL